MKGLIVQNIFNRSMGLLSNKFCSLALVFILSKKSARLGAAGPVTTSDFRIFSRGILSRLSLAKTDLSPYRTKTGLFSDFRIPTSDFNFPLSSVICPLPYVVCHLSSVLRLLPSG